MENEKGETNIPSFDPFRRTKVKVVKNEPATQ